MKKCSLPSYVVIGHRKIKAVLDSKMDDHGHYSDTDAVIKVNPSMIDPKGSLLHEMVHAALSISGVSEIIGNEKLEEAICLALEIISPNIEFKTR